MEHMSPPQIRAFLDALTCLPGVTVLSSGIESINELPAEHLSLVDLGHLPHGALRRTNGGLVNEALVQFEFRVEPSAAGWRSLEFLAWAMRDMARSGTAVQLRPFARPPQVGESVQLGHSLRFSIDLFCQDMGDDLSPVFIIVDSMTKFLDLAINLYSSLLYEDSGVGGV